MKPYKFRPPKLSISDRMKIDTAPFERLRTLHNRGYNGHPHFWFHVDKVLRTKHPNFFK